MNDHNRLKIFSNIMTCFKLNTDHLFFNDKIVYQNVILEFRSPKNLRRN